MAIVEVAGADKAGLRGLPWLTHLLAAVAFFSWLLWEPIEQYGLVAPDESAPSMMFMDSRILLAAWALAVPAIAVEVWAGGSRRWRWVARIAVCVATLVLAWVGALPVTLRFFGTREPVTHDEVTSAIVNYLTLLAGYCFLVVVSQGAAKRRRLRAGRAEPGPDSQPVS